MCWPTESPVSHSNVCSDGSHPRCDPSVYLEVPLAVLVDLGAVFPLPPFYSAAHVEGGLRLRGVVEGRLTVWALSHEGDWLGLVAYDVGNSDEGGLPQRVSHWLPARVLKPRD